VVHEPLSLFEESKSETEAVSKVETGAPARLRASLQAAAIAARLAAEAQARFSAVVSDARAAGLSWRRIGTVAGVPYQTLHRRFFEQARREVATRKRPARPTRQRRGCGT
jgi:hypothetical protein